MKKAIRNVIIILVLWLIMVPIIGISYLIYIQEDLFFPKSRDEESYKKLLDLVEYDEVSLDNNGDTVKGWIRYNSREEKSPLIIYFGGNFQNSSKTFNKFFEGKYDYFAGYNIISIDYPKYGLSEGEISDENLFKEALLVYDYSKNLELVDQDNIVVIGYSIGTGMATYLASQRDVKGLILVAPYDELLSIYNANLPIFYGPLKKLTKYKLESKKYAEQIDVKPLIFTSYSDEVINHNYSERLSEHFKNKGNIIILQDEKHSEYFNSEGVLEEIQDYLQDCKNK